MVKEAAKKRPMPLKTSELLGNSGLKYFPVQGKNLRVIPTKDNVCMPKGAYVPDDDAFMPFNVGSIPLKQVTSEPVNHYYVEMTRRNHVHPYLKNKRGNSMLKAKPADEFVEIMHHVNRDLAMRP